jgi:DNA-directed DNA polymerase III PolC
MYLNCHTSLSFKYGTLSVAELFSEAVRCKVHKLVLTEINNTCSYIEMLRLCSQNAAVSEGKNKYGGEAYDLEIVPGIEFRRDNELLYVGIARNNDGYQELNRYLSYHNASGKTLARRAPSFSNAFVVYPFRKEDPAELRDFEFVGVRANEVSQLPFYKPYTENRGRFVVLQPVTFADKTDFNIHRLMRAIDNNLLLSKLPPHLQAEPDEIMLDEGELDHRFASFPEIVSNTKRLLDQCHVTFVLGEDKNRKCMTASAEEDFRFLREEAIAGFGKRYNVSKPELLERFDHELRIIQRKGFVAYYLIAYDLIRFARERGFDYVGRGSGANSMVAYCLGITNVDPIELNLYFERFLNEERTSPPDFDIDFSWDNRDEIYEYIFRRYGQEHVCLLGTHVTFQKKSIIRELGKVFGLPKDEINALIADPKGLRNRDHITELIFRYAELMKDMPSNISIHAGGVLITEKPIHAYTATDVPPKGYPVSHFEMHAAEDFGIFKFDILSQRGLGHLKQGVELVKKNRGLDVDIHRFNDFKTDPKIRELLRNSRTMGCFYVESPAMRMLLGKLRCEDYITLVAASSIIRPGVASSGMMKAYIERFHVTRNGGTYESIHPKMDELMRETFGVMVYQEDVIKVAHHFAGLTLTEADVLRRGMSGKYRSRYEFQRVKDRFFENCRERGYAPNVIDRVWFEIESFSGYSFAKGHSASYAVESYQSLYLKAHFPLEFMVAVINNFGGFYKTEFYFHEARMSGGTIEPPCVNTSEYLTTLFGQHIFVGFIHLKSLEEKIAKQIVADRAKHGPFKSLTNLLERVPMGLEQVRILIRIGALRFSGKDKQRLLWEAMLNLSQTRTRKPSGSLFDTEPQEFPLPQLQRKPIEDAFDEIELLGFALNDPFELLETKDRGDCVAERLLSHKGRIIHMVGYIVTIKETWTTSNQHMNFGTFLDWQGNVFDTVHFPDVAKRFPFRGRGFYSIKGKVVEDFGVPIIEVSWMDKLPMINKRAEEFMRENVYENGGHHDGLPR